MTALKILGFIIAIITIITLATMLNDKYVKTFNFAIFSKVMAITQLINGLCFFFGKIWYDNAVAHNGDKLNGQVVMGLGIFIAIVTIIVIYQKTNFLYGTIGTIIHLGTLAFFSFIGAPLFVIYVIGNIVLLFSSKPVYVVNK